MRFIREIWSLFTNKIDIYKNLATLFKLEAKLAKLSIFPLLINFVLLLIVIAGFWITLMIGIGYELFLILHDLLFAILIILGIHFFVFAIVLMNVQRHFKNVSFKKTRYYLNQPEEALHGLNQDDRSKHSSNGNPLAKSTSSR